MNEHKNDEPEPVWWELSGNTGWLLYNGNAPFRIKAVVLRLAVGEIAELVGEDSYYRSWHLYCDASARKSNNLYPNRQYSYPTPP